MLQSVKNWMPTTPVNSRKRNVADSVYFLGKKCHYWLRCLLHLLNWLSGNKPPSSSIITYLIESGEFYPVGSSKTEKVDVRITDTTVEIFYYHNRIASHRRLYGRSGQYSTVTEHMPQEHQKYLKWNGERFRKWADSIGINTSKVVDAILTSGRIEQQSYRSCMGLLKLAEKYSPEKLEQVCAKALSYSGKPSYKSIKNLLVATKDAPDTESESSQVEKPHGITRGAKYYGGKQS